MTSEAFREIVEAQIETCKKSLGVKADEYATGGDRLSNFKRAGDLLSVTPVQALGGIMAKHVIALYDFMERDERDLSRWTEKITDTINYLILLKGLIREREDIF
jgi:hypothetical protein